MSKVFTHRGRTLQIHPYLTFYIEDITDQDQGLYAPVVDEAFLMQDEVLGDDFDGRAIREEQERVIENYCAGVYASHEYITRALAAMRSWPALYLGHQFPLPPAEGSEAFSRETGESADA